MCGLMATTDCTCDLWMPSVSSKLNGIRSKLSFGYSSPRPRVLWYSLMSFHSALYCYINYWRLSLMASIVVTTWCINSVSPFYVYECAVSIRSCLIQKLRLWSLCFILNSCITSCSVEFCRDSYRRNLQKLQIAVLKLKINFFFGKTGHLRMGWWHLCKRGFMSVISSACHHIIQLVLVFFEKISN